MERSFRSLLVRISTPLNHKELRNALWLKIAEKISFCLANVAHFCNLNKSLWKMQKWLMYKLILWSNNITRQINLIRTKNSEKCRNQKISNATFWVIFKQYEMVIGDTTHYRIRGIWIFPHFFCSIIVYQTVRWIQIEIAQISKRREIQNVNITTS